MGNGDLGVREIDGLRSPQRRVSALYRLSSRQSPDWRPSGADGAIEPMPQSLRTQPNRDAHATAKILTLM